MALHKDFPDNPHAILDPSIRWFPADEALRETTIDKLMPPLVPALRRKVKEFRDGGYVGATNTSKSLLNWWFNEPHLIDKADGTSTEFQYFFAQREALETIVYLVDVVDVKDKFDLMRFDGSGAVSAGNRADSGVAYDFVYVDEESFKKYAPKTFSSLLKSLREFK
jgi:type III restriction enzyme